MTDWFAGRVAERYDDDREIASPEAVDPVVDFLEPLAGGGALELAIGTGRIAIPLAARGVRVAGIDLSPDMVAQLRRKSGSIPVAIGDMTATRVEGSFSLVYLVFNTIMNLTTQDAQVACFQNAAAHLQVDGRFVIEVGVPDLQRLPRGEAHRPFSVRPDHLGIDEYDVVRQGLVSHHYRIDDDRVERSATPFRYVWPSELDLMARLAGLTLEDRWGGWRHEPFTAESTSHVSVWIA
ncbi:MAG TPA: class I SAM-dependent methyltransferase [Gaiellaceae bacterium]|nr:class I SAM-dependent methyltransferase [Gaiellaceae bacterium]